MGAGTLLYRALLRLYPRRFREYYADDLVLHFEDLVGRDGARQAWSRTAVDLLVTVPRYRLASALRAASSSQRRRLFVWTGLLIAASMVTLGVGLVDLGGDDHWPADKLLFYNALFLTLLIGALVSGVRALRPAPGRVP
jgi:hypothetical protein